MILRVHQIHEISPGLTLHNALVKTEAVIIALKEIRDLSKESGCLRVY